MCLLMMVCGSYQESAEWLLLPLFGKPSATHFTVPQPLQQFDGAYSIGDLE